MDLYISQPSSEREAYRSNWQLTQGSPTIQYSENIRLKYIYDAHSLKTQGSLQKRDSMIRRTRSVRLLYENCFQDLQGQFHI